MVQNARIRLTTESTEAQSFLIKPLSEIVIDSAIFVHNKLGPRLLKLVKVLCSGVSKACSLICFSV